MEFRVTFGQQYPREPHPTLALAHRDGWVSILAPDEHAARAEAHRVLDVRWSMLYQPDEPGYPTTEHYPLGELLQIVAATDQAVHLLRGYAPPTGGDDGGEVLVHVWRDGTGEVAYQPPHGQWGPPQPLTPAP
jgi:hypothetical protein